MVPGGRGDAYYTSHPRPRRGASLPFSRSLCSTPTKKRNLCDLIARRLFFGEVSGNRSKTSCGACFFRMYTLQLFAPQFGRIPYYTTTPGAANSAARVASSSRWHCIFLYSSKHVSCVSSMNLRSMINFASCVIHRDTPAAR